MVSEKKRHRRTDGRTYARQMRILRSRTNIGRETKNTLPETSSDINIAENLNMRIQDKVQRYMGGKF